MSARMLFLPEPSAVRLLRYARYKSENDGKARRSENKDRFMEPGSH